MSSKRRRRRRGGRGGEEEEQSRRRVKMWWRRGGSVDVMGRSINKHLERMTSVRKTEELEMDEIQKHAHSHSHTMFIVFCRATFSFR